MALARRHALEALNEPQYEFQDVPHCSRKTLEDTAVVHQVKDRDEWVKLLPELLLLCNEAAIRNEKKMKAAVEKWEKENDAKKSLKQPQDPSEISKTLSVKTEVCTSVHLRTEQNIQVESSEMSEVGESKAFSGSVLTQKEESNSSDNRCKKEVTGEESGKRKPQLPIHTGKPLSLEYIADRMDLDDPLHGYIVRDKVTGWLQGFVTVTTFTTWQNWFRFDSHVDEAGLLMYEQDGKGLEALHEMGAHFLAHQSGNKKQDDKQWWEERLVDWDGSLATALNGEIRDGDPNDEGVIWPRIAELSLLGGIGCGSFLLELIIEELEQSDSEYNYVVLQATENSVPFYESQGFVRVGAVARYHSKNINGKITPKANGIGRPRKHESFQEDTVATSTDFSTKLRSHIYDKKSFDAGKMAHLNYSPDQAGLDQDVPEELQVSGTSSPFYWYSVNTKETPTIEKVAQKVGVLKEDILFLNRRCYEGLSVTSKLLEGVRLRIPIFPKHADPLRKGGIDISKPKKAKETRGMVHCDEIPGTVSPCGLWYTTLEDDTPAKIARKFNLNAMEVVGVNRHRYPTLMQRSNMMHGTVLRLPHRRPSPPNVDKDVLGYRSAVQCDWGYVSQEEECSDLSPTICYRHWAFSDDPVALTHASYMMARPLKRDKNKSRTFTRIEQRKKMIVENEPKIWKYQMKSRKKAKVEKPVKIPSASVNTNEQSVIKKIDEQKKEEQKENTSRNTQFAATELEQRSQLQLAPIDTTLTPEADLTRAMKVLVTVKCPSMSRYHRRKVRLGPLCADTGNSSDGIGLPEEENKVNTSGSLSTMSDSGVENVSKRKRKSSVGRKMNVYIRNAPFPKKLCAFLESPLKAYNGMPPLEIPPTSPLPSELRTMLGKNKPSLFNKVVRLLPKSTAERRARFYSTELDRVDPKYLAVREHRMKNSARDDEGYTFFFVLTYIPDLKWARLAPMQQNGWWEREVRGCSGRPKWVLVPEGRGLEIDVSTNRCVEVPARAVLRSKDADDEQWVIG